MAKMFGVVLHRSIIGQIPINFILLVALSLVIWITQKLLPLSTERYLNTIAIPTN